MEIYYCGLSFGLRGSVLVVVLWVCGQNVVKRETRFRLQSGPSESKIEFEWRAKLRKEAVGH